MCVNTNRKLVIVAVSKVTFILKGVIVGILTIFLTIFIYQILATVWFGENKCYVTC